MQYRTLSISCIAARDWLCITPLGDTTPEFGMQARCNIRVTEETGQRSRHLPESGGVQADMKTAVLRKAKTVEDHYASY